MSEEKQKRRGHTLVRGVSLDPETWQMAKKLGHGNASRGVKKAIEYTKKNAAMRLVEEYDCEQ